MCSKNSHISVSKYLILKPNMQISYLYKSRTSMLAKIKKNTHAARYNRYILFFYISLGLFAYVKDGFWSQLSNRDRRRQAFISSSLYVLSLNIITCSLTLNILPAELGPRPPIVFTSRPSLYNLINESLLG